MSFIIKNIVTKHYQLQYNLATLCNKTYVNTLVATHLLQKYEHVCNKFDHLTNILQHNLITKRFFNKSVPQNSNNNDESPEKPRRPLYLMTFDERIWPHPLKTIKNIFFTYLINNSIDSDFSVEDFIKGSEMAMCTVSEEISNGNFDDISDLVSRDAISEIKLNYEELTTKQREFIQVYSEDIFLRFIYEIGMIFDDTSNRRFIEITTVFQGIHGLGAAKNTDDAQKFMEKTQEDVYIANYRFIREYTKGGVDDNWNINQLNHFSPKEIANSSNIFRR